MARKKKFVDLPVTKDTRTKIKNKKGKDSYDKFINKMLNFDFTGDET